jgi:hypothetical protein
MTPQQKLYLKVTAEKGRLLDKNEAFDFYVEHVMRNDATCKINFWQKDKNNRYKREDYPMWELELKAHTWHKLNIGSLVLQGFIPVTIVGPLQTDDGLSGFVKFAPE